MKHNTLPHAFNPFKLHHFSVIDLIEEEDDLTKEQEIFDAQDEVVIQLALCLEKLISSCSAVDPNQCKIATKRLKHLEMGLASISSSISSFPLNGDVCLLQQWEDQLARLQKGAV
jgi:hypothetical protein